MTEWITHGLFHDAAGVEDWRVLYDGAHAHFRTGSFAVGVALVDAIGKVAADRHPDVDLRSEGVSVGLTTREVDGLTERDVEVARQISAVARELGVAADPGAVQVVEVAVRALVIADVQPFWGAVWATTSGGPWTWSTATATDRPSGFNRWSRQRLIRSATRRAAKQTVTMT
jgi:4a-hydroxytetrahydrobiopterin dehydratase